MKTYKTYLNTFIVIGLLTFTGCVPSLIQNSTTQTTPQYYPSGSSDSTNVASSNWRLFFKDSNLIALIDTALLNNQELNIIKQEINQYQNEIQARKGAYLPFVGFNGGAGTEKASKYTRTGAIDENIDIKPGKKIPTPLSDYLLSAHASWEIDIWKKLRNEKKAAVYRYLASQEGRNFMITNLVSEIASNYYELVSLDKKLETLNDNIEIQSGALKLVLLQKQAGTATELAVKKFEAEVQKNKSRRYLIQQEIVEAENRINFLVGRFPTSIPRQSKDFLALTINPVQYGIPSQLLSNRPDIKQAELELEAAKIEVLAAKANFYPSLNISADLGFQAFNPKYLIFSGGSILYNLGGEIIAPLVNRNAIKATYKNANARQIQALYTYYQTILHAYLEVVNNLNKTENLQLSFDMKTQQVQTLNKSIDISFLLFRSARAEYMEVLMTQRDALDAKMELLDTKQEQMITMVNTFRSIGGGWK